MCSVATRSVVSIRIRVDDKSARLICHVGHIEPIHFECLRVVPLPSLVPNRSCSVDRSRPTTGLNFAIQIMVQHRTTLLYIKESSNLSSTTNGRWGRQTAYLRYPLCE